MATIQENSAPVVFEHWIRDDDGGETGYIGITRGRPNSLTGLIEILRDQGCLPHMRYYDPDNQQDRKYRDSGLWKCWNSKRHHPSKAHKLVFHVQVGCACMHDCCGHMCRHEVQVEMTTELFIVTINNGYNV